MSPHKVVVANVLNRCVFTHPAEICIHYHHSDKSNFFTFFARSVQTLERNIWLNVHRMVTNFLSVFWRWAGNNSCLLRLETAPIKKVRVNQNCKVVVWCYGSGYLTALTTRCKAFLSWAVHEPCNLWCFQSARLLLLFCKKSRRTLLWDSMFLSFLRK